MIGMVFQRYFHVGRATYNVTKISILAQLRKSTGYPLSNCKKALEMYPDDVEKAEKWLHDEAKNKGWSKWAKIQTRTATQGLIGVCLQNNVGVMIEINCETDFVSKNAQFQQIVEKILHGCVNYAEGLKLEENITKIILEEPQLNALQCESGTLGELVVAATCKFNEKALAKRAVFLKVSNDTLLNCLAHPATICPNLNGASLGKYGVLLVSKEQNIDTNKDIDSLKLSVCQHIIGLNPLTVGELTDKDIAKFTAENTNEEEAEVSENYPVLSETENIQKSDLESQNVITSEDQQSDLESQNVITSEDQQDEETESSGLKETNETQLLFQPFLMAPEVTVGETLFKSGLKVIAFERFECGETAEESPKLAMSANA